MDRLREPLTDALPPESATALLNLRADPEVEARAEGERGNAHAERGCEYKDFVEAVDIVYLTQAKARRFLSRQAA